MFQVLELYSSLQLKQGLILAGLPGSGKTALYRVLSRALNNLHSKKSQKLPEDDLQADKMLLFQMGQKLKVTISKKKTLAFVISEKKQ